MCTKVRLRFKLKVKCKSCSSLIMTLFVLKAIALNLFNVLYILCKYYAYYLMLGKIKTILFTAKLFQQKNM